MRLKRLPVCLAVDLPLRDCLEAKQKSARKHP